MPGKLVVIEGLDGSGKATQAMRLYEFFKSQGRDALAISFPNYNSRSSTLVQMYLNGEIGSLDEVNPFAASSFYSLDRYISYQTEWKARYDDGATIVADRYTTSNISHQMTKFPPEKWADYIGWLTEYEYSLLGLPGPDEVVYLDMHPETSKLLLTKRYHGDEQRKDIHEKDISYMLRCREAALFAANMLNWKIIHCFDENYRPLAVDDIFIKILDNLKHF